MKQGRLFARCMLIVVLCLIAMGFTAMRAEAGSFQKNVPGLTNAQWVSSFYAAYWGRAGDPGGLEYWLGEVIRGETDVPGVAENFALSAEAMAMYPYFNSPETAMDAERTTFVQAVYQNLLNRSVPADDEGVIYWVGELRDGNTTPGAVIGNMIHAAIQLGGGDWATIWNKIQAAEYFAQHFEASGQTWQDDAFDLARQALDGVTDDPATVETAKARVNQMFQNLTDPVTGMEFVWVPGGCYQMGCGAWTDSCFDNEYPVHEVCLDGFWMGKYEVTQGQWTQVMGSNPSHHQSFRDTYPVDSVSWNDVQGFITALNSRGSSAFRLPTEAEWEYAARSGGREERYAGGDDLDSLGWYSSNSDSRPYAVGTKAANGLGIYDMSGNVCEMVSDAYDADYYSVSPRENPQGPGPTGDGDFVYRGGSWGSLAKHCRAADRWYTVTDHRYELFGFRLASSSIGIFRTLTVKSTGASSIYITSNPSTYDGTTDYTKTNIPNGTSITLTAPATSGNTRFSSWTGCDSTNPANRTCTVTLNGNKAVTANYEERQTNLPGVMMLLVDE